MATESQVELILDGSERVIVQLGSMSDWVNQAISFTQDLKLDTAAAGSPFNQSLVGAIRQEARKLQFANQHLQARSIEPPQFQVEVQALIDRGSIVVPTTKVAAILARLRQSNAPIALVAQAGLAGVDVLGASIEAMPAEGLNGHIFRGLAWAEVLRRGLDRAAVHSLNATVEAAVSTEVGKLSANAKAVTELALDKLNKEAAAGVQREQVYEALRKKLEATVNDAATRLEGLEQSFRFQGSVKAAFEHWDMKAAAHRGHAWVFIGLFFLLLVVWAGAIGLVIDSVGGVNAKFDQIPYALTAVLAFLSLLGFWGGRLLVRQYLSERHLGEDAAERSALIKTFASMLEGQQIAADRTEVVLGALFRSAATGLLASDGSPTVPTDLIGKLLDRSKN